MPKKLLGDKRATTSAKQTFTTFKTDLYKPKIKFHNTKRMYAFLPPSLEWDQGGKACVLLHTVRNVPHYPPSCDSRCPNQQLELTTLSIQSPEGWSDQFGWKRRLIAGLTEVTTRHQTAGPLPGLTRAWDHHWNYKHLLRRWQEREQSHHSHHLEEKQSLDFNMLFRVIFKW